MAMIEEFRPFGKRMMITEFDTRTSDQEAYADYLRDLLIVAYADPDFDGFIMWGFWDAVHWLKNTPMYDEAFEPKPGLAVWEEWVLGAWRTDQTAATDAAGRAEVRGHHGMYDVTAAVDGQSVTRQIEFAGPAEVVLTVE